MDVVHVVPPALLLYPGNQYALALRGSRPSLVRVPSGRPEPARVICSVK